MSFVIGLSKHNKSADFSFTCFTVETIQMMNRSEAIEELSWRRLNVKIDNSLQIRRSEKEERLDILYTE